MFGSRERTPNSFEEEEEEEEEEDEDEERYEEYEESENIVDYYGYSKPISSQKE